MPLLLFDNVEVLVELGVCRVVDSLRSVECQGQHFERVLTEGLVVLAHIDKDSFLVSQLLVLFKPVVNA